MCNYTCLYCPKHDPINKKLFSTRDDLYRAVDRIAALERSSYAVTFSGGEPTVHPHLGDTICRMHERFESRLRRVDIITNGSRNDAFYDRLCNITSDVPIFLTVSLHVRFARLDHIEKLIRSVSLYSNMSFQVLMDVEHFDKATEFHRRLTEMRSSYAFNVNAILVMQKPDFCLPDPRYTTEQIAYQAQANEAFRAAERDSDARFAHQKVGQSSTLKWHYEERDAALTLTRREAMQGRSALLSAGRMNFKDMYCATGTRALSIDPLGHCRGAQCHVAPRSRRSLFDEAEDNPLESILRPTRCTVPSCSCAVNDVIPKFSDRWEAEEYYATI